LVFLAQENVEFPTPAEVKDAEAYKAMSLIRLTTRLIFCWFIREKA